MNRIYREYLTYGHYARKTFGEFCQYTKISFASKRVFHGALGLYVQWYIQPIFWKILKKRKFSTKERLWLNFCMTFAYSLWSYAVTGIFGGKCNAEPSSFVLNIIVDISLLLPDSRAYNFPFGDIDRLTLKNGSVYIDTPYCGNTLFLGLNSHKRTWGSWGDRKIDFPIIY